MREYNILIDKLPTELDGLKINADFRTCILFELLMNDNQISNENKILQAINLFYGKQDLSKYNAKDILNNIMYIYTGKVIEEKNKEKFSTEEPVNKKNIYNFEQDAEYIYSAFMQEYNIDLNKIEYMHWWKFKALFNSLSDKTLFSKIIGYRSINISEIQDKAQKNYYLRMKKIYALKDNRTEEEKAREFSNIFI